MVLVGSCHQLGLWAVVPSPGTPSRAGGGCFSNGWSSSCGGADGAGAALHTWVAPVALTPGVAQWVAALAEVVPAGGGNAEGLPLRAPHT